MELDLQGCGVLTCAVVCWVLLVLVLGGDEGYSGEKRQTEVKVKFEEAILKKSFGLFYKTAQFGRNSKR